MKQPVVGLVRALNDSGRFKYKKPEFALDHLVIGGGVVGLAIAQRLSQTYPSKSTYLLERHLRAGEETSSRNSEVVHSGLYYPLESLKTSLCLRGRHLLYDRCRKYNIPFKQCGKLVVARKDQYHYIQNLHAKCNNLKWPRYTPMSQTASAEHVLPTALLSERETRDLEPDLHRDIVGALWCSTTGILDSHAFMDSLERDVTESDAGELVYATKVVRIDRHTKSATSKGFPDVEASEDGWVVQAQSGNETYSVLARNVVNAAGLSSTLVLNSILPNEERLPMYFARGSYASYNGPGISSVKHLIYPCPETEQGAHAFQSLGTHLTLDLQGKVRFGPDIEWFHPPNEDLTNTEDDMDLWSRKLIPDEQRLPDIHEAVISYLPGISLDGLQSDYVGVRPKLIPPGGGFQDFVLRADYPSAEAEQTKANAMISLLGIESPGLTASLAIAELVINEFPTK